MTSTLTGDHKATYETIFRHPVSHNLDWRSLTALFNQLGELEEEPNGKLKFTRNGQSITLHSHGKDVEVDEIMHIRRFLDASQSPALDDAHVGNDLMIVLDHSGARIYRVGAEATEPIHVEPFDPRGHDQQVHNPNGDSGGQQGAFRKLFYENLAAKLKGAGRILMIGDGRGASSEVDHFLVELTQERHKALAAAIIGNEIMDISHMTDGELLAKGRELF